ncbi:hypothetical protein SISNIDRAFT_420699 [Sistotremastrum niveocremeum HHB9708]|uniref:Uncharacterized protein n=1 Tax=Sistotremastrum niveocremeum HHB9708 TaxID=1314777 RepID=A0A164ME34_9AGAM|nr:hypothetical protein SISNIDRAFT_420699 [Sistotremastrum niveocremeum HHB9708]
MEVTGASDEGFEAICATKLRNGGIVLELRSGDAAVLVRSWKDDFARYFEGDVIIRDQEYTVLAERVPTRLLVDVPEAKAKIERDSWLQENSIASIKWFKPENKRKETQNAAHLLI